MLETSVFQPIEINHGYKYQQTVEYALFLENLGHDNLIWQRVISVDVYGQNEGREGKLYG